MRFRDIFKDRRFQHFIAKLAALVMNIWFKTCRIKIIRADLHRNYAVGGDPCIGATWHRNAIFLVWFYGKVHPAIMFSRSNDGEIIATYAAAFGVVPVRGSSSSGGREARDEMKHFLARGGVRKAATAIDGPKGPRFVAKIGMLSLSKESNVPVLPIMFSASSAITLEPTWDKTMIPLPFSKVTVMYSQPLNLDGRFANTDDLEKSRRELEMTLNQMKYLADKDTGYDVLRDRKRRLAKKMR